MTYEDRSYDFSCDLRFDDSSVEENDKSDLHTSFDDVVVGLEIICLGDDENDYESACSLSEPDDADSINDDDSCSFGVENEWQEYLNKRRHRRIQRPQRHTPTEMNAGEQNDFSDNDSMESQSFADSVELAQRRGLRKPRVSRRRLPQDSFANDSVDIARMKHARNHKDGIFPMNKNVFEVDDSIPHPGCDQSKPLVTIAHLKALASKSIATPNIESLAPTRITNSAA